MFEIVNGAFRLCPAEYLDKISKLESETDVQTISKYFDYCDNQLERIIKDLDALSVDNEDDLSLSDFENVYQCLIESRVEDITGEIFLLENLIAPLDQNSEFVKTVSERIEMITALLLLVPDKVEKAKCILRAFDASDNYV